MPKSAQSSLRMSYLAAVGAVTLCSTLRAQGACTVPTIPPDSEPAGLFNDTNIVARKGGSAVKNTILVLFTADAPQAQRQAAVDLVHGTVVGGNRFLPDLDGNYLIRVSYDSSGARISKALAKLQALSQVDFAGTLDISESDQSSRAVSDNVDERYRSAVTADRSVPAGEVDGVVRYTRSGLPANGAYIAAKFRGTQRLISVVTSDRHGRFRIVGLARDSVVLSTRLIGYREEVVMIDTRSGVSAKIGLRKKYYDCSSVCPR